jgi:signal transduction histidine kinase
VTASLDASVAEAAEEVARREGIDLRLELAEGLRAPDLVHDALMRIVREAIHNAAEHGGAAVATVTLAADEGLLLRVEDDGKGFGPETPNGAGFGLVSMRERAEALGGTMQLSRGRDRGMRLEVRLP